jgi:hypothetical protein
MLMSLKIASHANNSNIYISMVAYSYIIHNLKEVISQAAQMIFARLWTGTRKLTTAGRRRIPSNKTKATGGPSIYCKSATMVQDT